MGKLRLLKTLLSTVALVRVPMRIVSVIPGSYLSVWFKVMETSLEN